MTDLFSNLNIVQNTGFVPKQPDSGAEDTDGFAATDDSPGGMPSAGPACEVCGKELPYSGRGRKPRFCQDHKTRTSATRGESSGSARSTAADKKHSARVEAIVGDLQQGVGELAGTISPVAPVTAGTMLLTGPTAIDSLVRIAADHPRMLDGLEAVAKGVPFVAVGKFVAGIMLAVMVDMGRMAPTGLAAEYLQVAEAAERVGWAPPSADVEGTIVPDRGNAPMPPKFKLAV